MKQKQASNQANKETNERTYAQAHGGTNKYNYCNCNYNYNHNHNFTKTSKHTKTNIMAKTQHNTKQSYRKPIKHATKQMSMHTYDRNKPNQRTHKKSNRSNTTQSITILKSTHNLNERSNINERNTMTAPEQRKNIIMTRNNTNNVSKHADAQHRQK